MSRCTTRGAVGVGERGSDLAEDGADDRHRQPAGVVNDLLQRPAADVPHDEEVKTLRLPHRKAGDDVGVIEVRDGDRFALEALDHALAHEQAGRHDLDRDLAVERDVVRQEHGGHARRGRARGRRRTRRTVARRRRWTTSAQGDSGSSSGWSSVCQQRGRDASSAVSSSPHREQNRSASADVFAAVETGQRRCHRVSERSRIAAANIEARGTARNRKSPCGFR